MPTNTAYHHLRHKWTKRHEDTKKRLWEKHGAVLHHLAEITKHFTVGSLSSLMLFALPGSFHTKQQTLFADASITSPPPLDKKAFLVTDLRQVLPDQMRPLSSNEEKQISSILQRNIGVPVAAEMNGIRLNRSYGYIGAEQHLARYPGDTMGSHFDSDTDADLYAKSGMAPGLGAYGYFAPSAQQMTKAENEREKYYIAVQTFLSPGYMENAREYNKFFTFRKMLVVSPNTGRAIVADIGDAGPAAWTGKHLGGSPEVMKYLERFDGRQRGAVLYFFIDDPNDTIPLGPVNY